MILERVLLAVVFAAPCLAQESAKSMFNDRSSNVAVVPVSDRVPRKGGPPKTAAPAPAVRPITALMYWIELRQENGQLMRVNANRQFKSGERIRLHVTSNVDGALTIVQSQNNGAPEMLFPPSRGGDNRVEAYKEKVFPSETGFFRFDPQAGNIRLLLMVQANGAPAVRVGPAADPPAPPKSGGGRRSAEPVQVASAVRAADMLAEIKKAQAQAQGSKKLEIDDSPTQPAIYEAVDVRKTPQATPGVIAVEVNLVQAGN
jgi:hypothetical protein